MDQVYCECGFQFSSASYSSVEVRRHFASIQHVDYCNAIDKKLDNARIIIKYNKEQKSDQLLKQRLFGTSRFLTK